WRAARRDGSLRIRQVDADEHPGVPRHSHLGPLLVRGRGRQQAHRDPARPRPQSPDRVCLPAVPAAAQAVGLAQRRVAAAVSQRERSKKPRHPRTRDGRPWQSHRTPADAAFRRPAATGRDRARVGHRPRSDPGRRADRKPRYRGEPRSALDIARAEPARPHDHRDHARPRGRSHRTAHGSCSRRRARAAEGRMSILHTIETGLRSLFGHRLRSVLTTLGILFGVAAVIATVGIGQASSDSVTARITSLGTNLLTVSPGSTVSGGVSGGGASANSLTMRDVAGLADRQNAPDIAAVAPVSQGRVSLVSTSSNWSTTLSGSTPDWLIANARSMSSGTFITSADVSTSAQVIVLGATTASNLGAGVGDLITVKQIPFQVIGILASTGSQGFGNQDDLAVVPL